jgi:hypothetical protein
LGKPINQGEISLPFRKRRIILIWFSRNHGWIEKKPDQKKASSIQAGQKTLEVSVRSATVMGKILTFVRDGYG